eukprot:COSAG01_NODE_68686_length_263_cov_0.939024_1_plen_31_part_01
MIVCVLNSAISNRHEAADSTDDIQPYRDRPG